MRKELRASLEDARTRVAELETQILDSKLEIDSLKANPVVTNEVDCADCSIFLAVLMQNPHPAPSTQQAEQASLTHEQIPKRASQFFLKLTKGNVVRCQSLELAGWYQTVPYLRLESHVR
jgi:hypothetical protein